MDFKTPPKPEHSQNTQGAKETLNGRLGEKEI